MKVLILFLALTGTAFAGGDREYTYNNTTIVTHNSTGIHGVALAIASAQHNFDFGTHSWQGSVGTGFYNGNSAVSFALGKRFNKVIISGSLGIEEGNLGGGIGVTWRF